MRRCISGAGGAGGDGVHGLAVLPMGRNMVLADMDAGLLFYFAMGARPSLRCSWRVVEPQQVSLLGAMRAVAQMISYEVVLLLSSVAVVMIPGRFADQDRGGAEPLLLGLAALVIFTPWGARAL